MKISNTMLISAGFFEIAALSFADKNCSGPIDKDPCVEGVQSQEGVDCSKFRLEVDKTLIKIANLVWSVRSQGAVINFPHSTAYSMSLKTDKYEILEFGPKHNDLKITDGSDTYIISRDPELLVYKNGQIIWNNSVMSHDNATESLNTLNTLFLAVNNSVTEMLVNKDTKTARSKVGSLALPK